MKNVSNQNHTIIKIRFSKLIILLCIGVYLLCGVGAGISVWRILRFGVHGFSDVLKYPFLIAVCLFCITLITSLLIRSQYVVTDEQFITQYGFVKSKFPIKTITELTLNNDCNKLTVNFGETFMVISVSPEWQETLINALLKANPDIRYEFTLTDKAE